MSELLVVARIRRPHGLTGEVAVEIVTDFPERFSPGARLLWRKDGEERRLTVASARPHGGGLLLRFDGVSSVDAARALAAGELFVAAEDAHAAGEDFYYAHEIAGWECRDTTGRRIGTAARLERTPAGPLLAVATEAGREALVPFVSAIVVAIDRTRRTIVLDPPEGLLEL